MKNSFYFQTAKVAGTPADGFWSQIHSFSPQSPDKKEKRGDLLAVLVIKGVSEGIGSVAAGREVLSRLHEEYYGNISGSAFERLSEAVSKVREENQNLEIVAGALLGSVLYLAILGEGKVYLKRGEKAGFLLHGGQEIKTASGHLQEGDLFVFGSSQFFSLVSSDVLKTSLESGSLEEASDTLGTMVLGKENVAAAAAVLALTQKEEELFIEPVVSEVEEVKSAVAPLPGQKPSVFVRTPASERKKKVYFFISLVLLGLLGVSLIFGFQKKTQEKKMAKAQELLRQAEEKLNQGKALALDDPSASKVLGKQAQNLAEEAVGVVGKETEEIVFLREKAESFLSSLGQEIALSQPQVFMDLTLIEDGGAGRALTAFDKNLAILSSTPGKIYLLNAEKKSHEILSYSGSSKGILSATKDKLYLLAIEGIAEVNPSQKKALIKIEADNEWKDIAAISTYGSHLYLLDRGSNSIWRYLGGAEGFGDKKNWFIDEAPSLAESTSMAIDGAIWIAQNNHILRFNLGKQERFALNKMPDDFKGLAKIYTSENTENLYALDKGAGKVYVIAKDGNFKAAYSWEGLKQADDLVAFESLKKLFILSGSKIYEINLK